MAFFIVHTARTFSTILRKSPANQFIAIAAFNRNDSPINNAAKQCAPSQTRHAHTIPAKEVKINAQPNVEIIHNPPEWKYVERILPTPLIPQPKSQTEYMSGWKPQSDGVANKFPYFIRRSKNHMVPVYLMLTYRGTKKQSLIKNITGDIWKLEKDVSQYVEWYMAQKVTTQVNEFVGTIRINGDHVNLVKDYLISKGF